MENNDFEKIITLLDKWIDDSESKFELNREQYFNGMAQAYWNVKQFIQVNFNKNQNEHN